MVDHSKIYQSQASGYQELIIHEDVEGNLLPALEDIASFTGKTVLDLGTGTGRIPYLLGDKVKQVIGLDLYWDMLRVQKTQGISNELIQADFRFLPTPQNTFDIVTAGWSISALRGGPDNQGWEANISLVLQEIHRTIRKGGAIIIIETMSTANTIPRPPTSELAEYYSWLETEWGFDHQVIQTDYQFNDLDHAVATIGFFFGDEMASKVKENTWVRVPEWTGIWSKLT